ncbi:hypothetical protein [Chryseobacterium paridis]|uniref:YD repeat-containing protein n=1 Tax=Chryseobacterium paridis TaxID=2800328 RepID=A0ABS1G0R0_9FLAO|nr:hypothetical protein [Chryseobacterium paridis]MBK1898281.1 hypothetical protein [Chryseobacterium paridis]
MKRLIILLIIWPFLNIYGQKMDHIQNITPQPPEVNAILKSFETPVSLYTGTPDISVPIYSIKEGDINFDLKLSYNSTGITVGERASWVGLGWNLSVPTLVRNVRQVPDDFPNGFFYETNYTVKNVYNITSAVGPDVPMGQLSQVCPQCVTINSLSADGQLDLESDDYRITLPDGKSISFMVNQERDGEHPIGHIVQFPDSDYKIDYITSSGNWEITNPQGYKYIYIMGNRIISQQTYTIGGNSIGVENPVKTQPYRNTWALSKIISPSNRVLNFEYDPVLYEDCDLVNQTKTVAYDEMAFPNDARNMVFTNYSKTKGNNLFISRIWGDFGEVIFNKDGRLDYTTYGKKLNSIEIKNKYGLVNKIAFDFDYMTSISPGSKLTCNRLENDNDISKRLILKKIRFNADEQKPLSYQFNYNNQALPNRLSYARDWWGYYNGQDNNLGLTPSIDVVMAEENDRNVKPAFTKAGILEEIIYPTGGKTKFLFESNRGIFHDYNNTAAQKIHDIIPFAIRNHFFSTNENTTPMLNKVYQFPLPVNGNEATFTGAQRIEIFTNTNQCIYPDDSLPLSNSCSIFYTVIDSNNEIVVPKSLLRNQVSRILEIPRAKLISGLKLKVELYAGKNLPGSQVFDYNQHEANISFSYKAIDTTMAKVTPHGTEVPFGGLRIKRIENFENITNPIIKEYDYRYEGIETGLSLFELDFLQTTPGRLFVTSQSKFPMQTGNGSLISYTNAKELRINPLTNERNSISHEFDNKYVWGSYVGSCFFNAGVGVGGALNSSSVPCYESPLNGKSILLNYSDKQKESYEYQNVLMAGKNLNNVYGMDYDRVVKPNDLNYMITGPNQVYLPAEFFYYNFKNFDEPDYFKEVKENLNGQEITTKSQYSSLSSNHHQMTKLTTTSPDGTVNETNYSYAHEKGNQLMITKNMVGIPIETNTTQTMGTTTKMLDRIETVYPISLPTTQTGNLLLPLSINSYNVKDLNTNVSTPAFSVDILYDKYDAKGNIQQYTTKDGISTTVIWGYNNTQPIAKVIGAKLSDIPPSLITSIVNASNDDNTPPQGTTPEQAEQSLILALDNFRKNSGLSSYQISTYTYDPLIGVTSITPPSGIREVYIYDTANRLKEIRQDSKTGNLVKEFKYNYKQ